MVCCFRPDLDLHRVLTILCSVIANDRVEDAHSLDWCDVL